ncbi:hypothetical protein TrRE_jg11370 [Triparma retinervis]|uniref:Uncharacterized protein n=1 Tax=Triparma retinervis TaxID=2557542 RepID=A0A9W7G363_9STRA|nr:hypothetical protein TrRE_jg11370 [Triparma retinervis]
MVDRTPNSSTSSLPCPLKSSQTSADTSPECVITPDSPSLTITPDDASSSPITGAIVSFADAVNANISLTRTGLSLSVGCLLIYALRKSPPFTRYSRVSDIPSRDFSTRDVIRGRLVSIVPRPPSSPLPAASQPVAFRFVPLTWFERTFLNVRSIFDPVHRNEEGILVQLRNVSHPPESPDLLIGAPKVTWLESFVFQKPYVACSLISRKISGRGGRGGEEMAVVDVSWRPYMQWKHSDLATSLIKYGRADCEVEDASSGGVEIGGTVWDLNLDSSRKMEDLERDVQRIKELIRLEGEAKGEGEEKEAKNIFQFARLWIGRLSDKIS